MDGRSREIFDGDLKILMKIRGLKRFGSNLKRIKMKYLTGIFERRRKFGDFDSTSQHWFGCYSVACLGLDKFFFFYK